MWPFSIPQPPRFARGLDKESVNKLKYPNIRGIRGYIDMMTHREDGHTSHE